MMKIYHLKYKYKESDGTNTRYVTALVTEDLSLALKEAARLIRKGIKCTMSLWQLGKEQHLFFDDELYHLIEDLKGESGNDEKICERV